MRRLDLAGEWRLEDLTTGQAAPGRLPGQNYPDLMAAGLIDDPFWGANEAAASELGGHDFRYRREFDWAAGGEKAVLVIVGLDTFAEVELNGRPVLSADNAFRTWRADVTGALVEGRNQIAITFASPLPRIAAAARRTKLRSVGFGAKAAYIRKPQCHFGWDWGPNLPPVGVTGSAVIEIGADRLADVRVAQDHQGGGVKLTVSAEVESAGGGGLTLAATLEGPDGEVVATAQQAADAVRDVRFDLAVARPRLWWPNGLGGQPLYRLTVALGRGGDEVDRWEGRLGLRTVELDQPAQGRGRGLRFRVNGHPVFAKGADWIPSDTFVTRTGRDRLERLIAGAARANMNMLRVWGGGYYESDDFYDLCDQYGVLVWQDCAFACSEYPLAEPSFVESVQAEVRDNVRRLRHHASLALWCGNNEVFILLPLLGRASKRRHQRFFFETLAGWIRREDPATP